MIVGRSLTGCLAYSLRPNSAEATVAADGKNVLAASTKASACVGSCTAMQQIADWLEKLGMSEYARRFAENNIDFTILGDLTDQDLEKI